MMKTPEQEALEAQESAMEAEKEQRELELKKIDIQLREQQGQQIISVLSTIAEQMQKPITVMRDENGNLIGAD